MVMLLYPNPFSGPENFWQSYGATLWPSIVNTAILVGGFSLKILEEWGEGGMYERGRS